MEERITPLRKRMIEDMNLRGMGAKAQKAHIRAIKDCTRFLGDLPTPPRRTISAPISST